MGARRATHLTALLKQKEQKRWPHWACSGLLRIFWQALHRCLISWLSARIFLEKPGLLPSSEDGGDGSCAAMITSPPSTNNTDRVVDGVCSKRVASLASNKTLLLKAPRRWRKNFCVPACARQLRSFSSALHAKPHGRFVWQQMMLRCLAGWRRSTARAKPEQRSSGGTPPPWMWIQLLGCVVEVFKPHAPYAHFHGLSSQWFFFFF